MMNIPRIAFYRIFYSKVASFQKWALVQLLFLFFFAIPVTATFNDFDLDPTDSLLAIGGSFSPPTLEHTGLVARIIYRFGFQEATFLPTVPYKNGAAPADVTIHLLKVATQTFYETLDANGMAYSQFQSPNEMTSSWVDEQTHSKIRISLDPYDIENSNKNNAYATISHLRDLKGHPRKVFWISGGDSFASVPTWRKHWEELFDLAHWIVVARPGFETQQGAIVFGVPDPLRHAGYPSDFLNKYELRYFEDRGIYLYKNKDSQKPNIYIIDQPVANDSSSLNRASLNSKDLNHDHAREHLAPSVFYECVMKGYYTSDSKPILTNENLAFFLKNRLRRIEIGDENIRSDQIIKEYQNLMTKFIQSSSTAEASDPTHSKADANGDFNLWSKVRSATEDKISLFFNLVYLQLTPGNKVWQLLKEYQQRKALADDDFIFFKQLTDYRNRLMRGNPELIKARLKIELPIGLHGEDITLNIVKSRLPSWVPLSIRNNDNAKVKWYDLNLSTNELEALINNKNLLHLLQSTTHPIEESVTAEAIHDLYPYTLLASVLKHIDSLNNFVYFIAVRYFERLAFGEVPNELLHGFSDSERQFINRIKSTQNHPWLELNNIEQTELKKVLSHIYAIRLIQSIRGSQLTPDDWQMILNYLGTGYPNRIFKFKKDYLSKSVMRQLRLILAGLYELDPSTITKSQIVTTSGQSHFSGDALKKLGFSPLPAQERPHQTAMIEAMKHVVLQYLRDHRGVFPQNEGSRSTEGPSDLNPGTPLTRFDDGSSQANLIWEIHLLQHSIQTKIDVLNSSYKRSLLIAQERDRTISIPETETTPFRLSLLKSMTEKMENLKSLEFSWLKIKFSNRTLSPTPLEMSLPEYLIHRRQFQKLRTEMEEIISELRAINLKLIGIDRSEIQRKLCSSRIRKP